MKNGLGKRLFHACGKAVSDWDMISNQDRILVGLSGGLDSQTLLHVLHALEKKAPVKFDILPVHVDPGFEGSFARELETYVGSRFSSLRVEYTDFGLQAHAETNRENPCFLCSRLRRKRLFDLAEELGCNKIALGHTQDDLIETLFLNMFYAGKIGTMKPKQSFFQGNLDIIRPLAYVDKQEIERFAKMHEMSVFMNNCPSVNDTKRGEIRQMLEAVYKNNTNVKGNLFRAMGNIAHDYLLEIKK